MLSLVRGPEERSEVKDREHLSEIIENRRINPVFQPIVEFNSGDVYAYEVLSRCEEPFNNPAEMFARARNWGLSWELENASRMCGLERIAAFGQELREKRYFFNVSPYIFNDSRFVSGTTVAALKKLGLRSQNIVFEITETATVEDYEKFEELIRYYVAQGFQVALDDFGAGHSGLVTLVAMAPHFLKIDMALVQGISESSYKQNLVRAIASFAREVDTACIAEGIENFEDLETLFRLGIHYGQGFLLGRPSPEPRMPDAGIAAGLERLIQRRNRSRFSVDVSLSGMVVKPKTFGMEEITCEELEAVFRKESGMDHVVIMSGALPYCLITRRHFYSVIGGRFGYSLFQKKYAETIAKSDMLSLDEHIDLRTAGRLAMDRNQDDLYDPVVITGTDGRFIGTITMKQVINKAFDMEIKIATGSNPLTQLPGNMIIGFWLEEAIRSADFAVVYGDLDNFKAYNDAYGFSKGDDALRMTAKVLNESVSRSLPAARLGHIGGDDFIIVTEDGLSEEYLQELCTEFDAARGTLFSSVDAERGWYETVNRKGEQIQVPLVSLSLAVVTGANFTGDIHPGQLGQVAAMIKHKVKARNLETGSSGFLIDRRVYI